MLRITLGLLVLFSAPLVVAAEPAAGEEGSTETVSVAKETLGVSISLPKRGDKRTLTVGGAPEAFHVVVTNLSEEPVRLWRDWCSWGYFNLSFELQFGDDKPIKLAKQLRGWDKNYPDFLELPPGEHLVLSVQLTAEEWNLAFEKAVELRRSRIRAVFTIEADDDSRRLGVWTGRVESAAIEVMLHDAR